MCTVLHCVIMGLQPGVPYLVVLEKTTEAILYAQVCVYVCESVLELECGGEGVREGEERGGTVVLGGGRWRLPCVFCGTEQEDFSLIADYS